MSNPATHHLTEAAFQQRVIDLARLRGWRCCHFRPAPTVAGWRTPVTGDPGFPDLALARAGRLLAVELKSERGRLSPDQAAWLAQLGDHGRLWRPSNWTEIIKELQ
jgi:VRR-NUC domain